MYGGGYGYVYLRLRSRLVNKSNLALRLKPRLKTHGLRIRPEGIRPALGLQARVRARLEMSGQDYTGYWTALQGCMDVEALGSS